MRRIGKKSGKAEQIGKKSLIARKIGKKWLIVQQIGKKLNESVAIGKNVVYLLPETEREDKTDMTLEEKVERSRNLIRQCVESGGEFASKLIVGHSSGKDSCVVYDLVMDVCNSIPAYYANTTIDPPGTAGFMRREYPQVEILQPKESFIRLVERKGLPTRLNRFCCERLKEYVGIGRNMFEGVRAEESRERQGREYIQCDSRRMYKGGKHIYPIYDWTEQDVWEYIRTRGIKTNPNYRQNGGCMDRIGCVGCPLAGKYQRIREFEAYPRYYESIRKAIGRGMADNPQWKLTQKTDGDSHLAMKWWMSRKTMDEFFGKDGESRLF